MPSQERKDPVPYLNLLVQALKKFPVLSLESLFIDHPVLNQLLVRALLIDLEANLLRLQHQDQAIWQDPQLVKATNQDP